jgi:hypothetical protein
MDESSSPSTAAMTTLSIAVSVAVVMLDNIRIGPKGEERHQLDVYLTLFCVSFLGQPSKPALKVIAASPGITRLTLVILNDDRLTGFQIRSSSCPRLTGKKFLIGEC